jgi:hypothetical protein
MITLRIFKRNWEEVGVIYFKRLPKYSLGGTDENHEKFSVKIAGVLAPFIIWALNENVSETDRSAYSKQSKY